MSDEQLADKKNPPSDDAPIEELMEYWRVQGRNSANLRYGIAPSRRVLERICAEIASKSAT